MARTYRFFSALAGRGDGRELTLTDANEPDIFFQMTRVLRARNGDKIILTPSRQAADGHAATETFPKDFQYEIVEVGKRSVTLKLTGTNENRNELGVGLHLVLCVPNKPDKLDFIVQKATELGVKEIILVQGDFSQMKHNLKQERLEKILKEAAEQSERAYLPGLAVHGTLLKYLESLSEIDCGKHYAAMERIDNEPESSPLKVFGGIAGTEHEDVFVIVGPEGGFSENEKEVVRTKGIRTFSLGKRILRMETAAILSLGLFSIFPDPR